MILNWAKENICLVLLIASLSSASIFPTSQQRQGNKRRVPYKIQIERSDTGYFYSSGCEERILSWSGWSGGLNGKILVKKAGDPGLPTWSIVVQLDKSVKDFKAYDTKTEKLDDRTYKISPLDWNAKVKEAATKTVNLQVWWNQGEAEPKIRYFKLLSDYFKDHFQFD